MTTPLEELAMNILFKLDMNTCVCDCLGCKTEWCGACTLNQHPPYKRNDLCCENDLTGLVEALKQTRRETREEDAKIAEFWHEWSQENTPPGHEIYGYRKNIAEEIRKLLEEK